MVKKLDAIKIYEIAESGNTGGIHFKSIQKPRDRFTGGALQRILVLGTPKPISG